MTRYHDGCVYTCYLCLLCYFFFFFQAEDGIRDVAVTGVQTCALPICYGDRRPVLAARARLGLGGRKRGLAVHVPPLAGQLDRGRYHRGPEEHHRRAHSRLTEGLGERFHGFWLQRRAGDAPRLGAEVLRER